MLDICFEKEIKIHFNLSKKEFNINNFVNYCKTAGEKVSHSLFVSLMLFAQQSVLTTYLGAPWSTPSRKTTPWECPKCASRVGFKRRGKRSRTMKTSLGKVCFSLLQVTCSGCDKTFSPFPELLGLGSRHQLTRELEQKLCRVVKDVSYRKTANWVNEIFNLNLTPHTVHRTVQKHGTQAKIVEDLSQINNLQVDSTKINASANKRGIDVHLALSLGKTEQRNGRTYRHKTLAAVTVSKSPTAIKKLLKKSHVEQLTVDGKSGLEKFVENKKIPTVIQRCLWHIPRTAAHMMYLDGLSTLEGRKRVAPLKAFLFDEKLEISNRIHKYEKFIKDCQENGFENTVTFLKNAKSNLFNYKQFADRDIHGATTSVIERQMREINRRMENGARWSKKGAQNLLQIKFIQEMNPLSYDNMWRLTKNSNFIDVLILN